MATFSGAGTTLGVVDVGGADTGDFDEGSSSFGSEEGTSVAPSVIAILAGAFASISPTPVFHLRRFVGSCVLVSPSAAEKGDNMLLTQIHRYAD